MSWLWELPRHSQSIAPAQEWNKNLVLLVAFVIVFPPSQILMTNDPDSHDESHKASAQGHQISGSIALNALITDPLPAGPYNALTVEHGSVEDIENVP